jgi:uncharacterized DUF497 family protein
MGFEWDSDKAASNLVKHGISFDEAVSALYDPFALTYNDPDHSADEERSLTVGLSRRSRLLMICHTERGQDTRIISARLVTRAERRLYEHE